MHAHNVNFDSNSLFLNFMYVCLQKYIISICTMTTYSFKHWNAADKAATHLKTPPTYKFVIIHFMDTSQLLYVYA